MSKFQFVRDLRNSIINSTSFQLWVDPNQKTNDVLAATLISFENTPPLKLSDPSGYNEYDSWTVLFFYLNKQLDHPTYLQLCAGKNKESVSFLDRRDLLDFLTGQTAESVHVKKAIEAQIFGFDLSKKRELVTEEMQQYPMFISSEEIRQKGEKKPMQLTITRDPKKHAISKFLVIDSIDTMTEKDWGRVVAVFTCGQEWQFKGWKWEKPVDIFSKVLGFSLKFQDEPPSGSLAQWNVKILDELQLFAKGLGLDPVGPRSAVKDRVIRYLKQTNPSLLPQSKKRRSKKKKSEKQEPQAEKIEPIQDEAEAVDAEVEIVPETLRVVGTFEEFSQVFQKFNTLSTRRYEKDDEEEQVEEDDDNEFVDKEEIRQTKKKLKKLNRMTVAQLKQSVRKPEVVDWVDVTSSDPLLLVQLKSTRNTVPVPSHWSQKRKYLQGKRGIEKPPFELPEYIKATGIMQLRQSGQGPHSLQGKARERHNPKLGRLDIDYQKLHDAFFRYQTKPLFSQHGDIYFEGKEFETRLRMRKPGVLSEELKIALNIPHLAPPPWLINMQRYGPPPSYPQLKIPGLNAPIPEGAQWGFHPGGWGKPPCDEFNRPLYGDVFGTHKPQVSSEFVAEVESKLWGELDTEVEEEEEEEDEEEEDDEEEEQESVSGLETPSGIASAVPSGIETPDFVEMRKEERVMETRKEQKSLYTVLSSTEKTTSGFMASTHTYQVKDKLGLANKQVDVSLNPEELENIDQETLKRKYESSKPQQQQKEDFSDMVNEHAEKQAFKRQKKEEPKKKFKF
ncbi:hypothetical protein HDV01_001068 [Terramyces sp. JEL0728]|nr:hypothetical protein HDV01_001068 [Terramyces sp. JEL0728]